MRLVAQGAPGGSDRWRAVAAQMLDGARAAFLRFPVTVFLLLAAAVNTSLLIEDAGLFVGGGKNNFVVPLLGGALAALASCLFWEPRSRDLWVRHCGSLIAAVCAACLLWLDTTTRTVEWILVAALAGFVPVAAYIWHGTGSAFWLFSVRLVFAAILAVLALLLFAGGVSAVLAGLTYLFAIDVPARLYEHVWALAGLFAAPLFGLGQIPLDFSEEPVLESGAGLRRGVRALGDFVAAPLLFVYAVMLHAYALKIVLFGTIPDGQIGWLVLAFGFFVFGTIILVHPYRDSARAPSRLLARLWPFMLPVPLLLLYYALYLRVAAYGLTPDRYMLGLFALVATILLFLQLVPRMRGDIRVMVWLPAFAMLFASFGSQGAVAISIRSQTARFLAIVHNPPINPESNDRALSALRYLSGQGALNRVVPPDFSGGDSPGGTERAIALAWGLEKDRPGPASGRFFSLSFAQERAVAVKGFDLVVPSAGLMAESSHATEVFLPDGGILSISLVDAGLSVREKTTSVHFAIDPTRVESIIAAGTANAPRILLDADGRQVVLVPTFLYGETTPQAQIRNFGGAILLRSSDW